MQDRFAINPLEDPLVDATLSRLQMTGQQLINASVRELNKRLMNSCLDPTAALQVKRCRRILKNRGYAKNCRIKRIVAKTELERANAKLLVELNELRQRNKSLSEQVRFLLQQQQQASQPLIPSSIKTEPYEVSTSHGCYSGPVPMYQNPNVSVQTQFRDTRCMLQGQHCSSLSDSSNCSPMSSCSSSLSTNQFDDRSFDYDLGLAEVEQTSPLAYTGPCNTNDWTFEHQQQQQQQPQQRHSQQYNQQIPFY